MTLILQIDNKNQKVGCQPQWLNVTKGSALIIQQNVRAKLHCGLSCSFLLTWVSPKDSTLYTQKLGEIQQHIYTWVQVQNCHLGRYSKAKKKHKS